MSRRLFVAPETFASDCIFIEGDDFHYLFRVLRLAKGDAVVLLDGRGGEADTTVTNIEKTRAELRVLRRQHCQPALAPLCLQIALLKGEKMDWVIQKATELGVTEIVPVVAARSVALPGRGDKKQARWYKIAQAAAQQCERTTVPHVAPPQRLEDAVRHPSALRLWAAERIDGGPFPKGTAAIPDACCLIGPEGGFTDEEQRLIRAAGYLPTSLGPLVLRAETAAVALLAIVGHLRRMTPATQSG